MATPTTARHRAIVKLHARAAALHADVQRDLRPGDDAVPLAYVQVSELAERLAQSLATCLSTLTVEDDVERWKALDPTRGRKERAA